MDYEKIHKETLEGLKRLVSEGNITEDVAKKICPDFVMDSEDERIRKEIVELIENNYACFRTIRDKELALAYLERLKEQKPVEYLNKDKAYAIMTKLTNLSYSKLIPINSDEYKKLHEITSDVRDLLDYPIEQKPAECIEFDNEFKNQVSHLLASVLNKEWEYDKGLVEYAAQQLLGYAKHEIKPIEWSEEDEKMINILIRDYEYAVESASGVWKNEFENKVNWLKDLPNRIALQSKQEWSEEDEKMHQALIHDLGVVCEKDYPDNVNLKKELDWFKSRRPQPKSIISDTDKSNLRDVPAIIRKSNHPFKENIALIIEKYL